MSAGTGTNTGVDEVLATVRGLTLLRIEWLRRRLGALDENGSPAQAMHELSNALKQAGEAADPILTDPRVGAWCAELGNLLDRGAGTLLPDGHFRAACRRAETLTLSARLLRARAYPGSDVPPCQVRADRTGQIRLPGTWLAADCGAEFAGCDVTIEVLAGSVVLPGVPHSRLITERAPLPGVVASHGDAVDAGQCGADPILHARSPVVAVERGPDRPRSAARPGIAVAPATASARWRAAKVAAAAAHLRSSASGMALLTESAALPPPGLVDVADAGQVTRLLELFERGGDCKEPAAGVAIVLGEIADWLARAGRLTEPGELARDRLASFGFEGTAPPSGTGRRRAPAWRTHWLSAGGRWRQVAPRVTRLPAAGAELDGLLAELGAPDGVEVNALADERGRADQTIDHLSLMSARDPERFAATAGRLGSLPPSPARDLLTGHVAYIREHFSVAADVYASLLSDLPHDIDLWRDFAFALRHMGEVELSEVALFRLPDVVERASACQLEPGPLAAMHAEASRWRTASSPVRQLAGLLEWIRLDPDHR